MKFLMRGEKFCDKMKWENVVAWLLCFFGFLLIKDWNVAEMFHVEIPWGTKNSAVLIEI